MQPYPGLMVLYRQREPRAGQLDLAAMVTRAWPDGRVDLNVYPPMAEFYQLPKVPMLSETFTGNVWLMADNSEMPRPTAGWASEVVLETILDRVAALEAKRGPGRPPNSAKAEQAA